MRITYQNVTYRVETKAELLMILRLLAHTEDPESVLRQFRSEYEYTHAKVNVAARVWRR